MISLCVLFVHGLGWQFHSAALRYLVSPLTLWPLTLLFTLMTLQLI
jgi:predicted membrane protein